MRIGTRLSTVAVACSLVALALYGLWSVSIRRDQLMRELAYESRSLATVLRGALELAPPQQSAQEAREVVDRLAAAERVFGIAVHSPAGPVAQSEDLEELRGTEVHEAVRAALSDGLDRQLHLVADGERFFVQVLPLRSDGQRIDGVAEVWRDLGYIDEYLRSTALRLMLLALTIGAVLTAAIVFFTGRLVTRPARELVRAMDQVAEGNLAIRVADGRRPPQGELGDIARSFDRLASSLQEARAALDAGATERASLASRLRQSERLATLGQVVAEVAHEVGTPLNVIGGRAEFLARIVEDDEQALATARAIGEQTRRITRIIQRLLDVARERMPVSEDVHPLEIARRTGDFLAPDFASAQVALSISGEKAVLARADADLLQQVLMNLMVNALQASPRHGAVRVEVGERDGQVVIDVSDEGPGVAEEMLPRLFEPFSTTKPAGKGTGLGLSISRSILRQMGGTLRYLPRRGGAHFQATLLSARAEAA